MVCAQAAGSPVVQLEAPGTDGKVVAQGPQCDLLCKHGSTCGIAADHGRTSSLFNDVLQGLGLTCQWKPRYRLFTTWYNGKANSWFWSNCIAALTHHDTALRTTDSQAALQPSPTMDRREHPWASIVEDASIIPARTSISQHIARLTACNIPRELQIMPDMKTPVALPLRLLLKWFRNNHVRWSWSLKGGVHETYNGHSWGTSRARCKEDQRQIVDGTAWDAGKGSKETQERQIQLGEMGRETQQQWWCQGSCWRDGNQEVEKEVAAEVRPVRKLNIKKKAPRFAALIVITSWTVATVGDSHDGMMVGTDGYHLPTSFSIRPECSGQSWVQNGNKSVRVQTCQYMSVNVSMCALVAFLLSQK